jgi:hypothetical protein
MLPVTLNTNFFSVFIKLETIKFHIQDKFWSSVKQATSGYDNIHCNATNCSVFSRNLVTYSMNSKVGSMYSMNMKRESEQNRHR